MPPLPNGVRPGLTAFGPEPAHQALGLGATVEQENSDVVESSLRARLSATTARLIQEHPNPAGTIFDLEETPDGTPLVRRTGIKPHTVLLEILQNPLQMAVLTAAVANGGIVYQPQLVRRVLPGQPRPPRVLSRLDVEDAQLEVLRAGMVGAVAYGTATAAYAPWGVAGKTGTVENSPSADNPEGRNHTWFACYSPVEKPRIAVVVLVEKSGGYGGAVAAPVARKVIEAWHRLEESSGEGSSPRDAGDRAALVAGAGVQLTAVKVPEVSSK